MTEKGQKQFGYQIAIATLTAVIVSAMLNRISKNESLESQLVFYASYHQDPVNVAIHVIFIPLILWTSIVILSHFHVLGLELSIPGIGHRITWGTSTFIVYAVYYVWMDCSTGSLAAIVMFLMYLIACKLANPSFEEKGCTGHVLQIAIFLHVLSWYMQIHPGHMIYEGVKPALFDSLGDAISVAPLFSLYDVVWELFPSSSPDSLQARVLVGVLKRRLEMCRLDGTLSFCS